MSPTAAEVETRLAEAPRGRRRGSPRGPKEDPIPRGDHELNPDIYDPLRRLTAAAVLVPLIEHESGLTVLLTLRSDHLRDHAGQIAFPGGQMEGQDLTPEETALRETEEEIGLDRDKVRVVGRLDSYITRTGFEVTPVVGFIRPPFSTRPDPFEVTDVFEVPLSFFLEPGNRQTMSRVYEGKERYFHAYPYGERFIWGATAGMLNNLVEVLSPS